MASRELVEPAPWSESGPVGKMLDRDMVLLSSVAVQKANRIERRKNFC